MTENYRNAPGPMRRVVCRPKLLIKTIATGLFLLSLTCRLVSAQASDVSAARAALPEAPQQSQNTNPTDMPANTVATLIGTILDTNHDVLQGARVTVSGVRGHKSRVIESGNDGQFVFKGLAPGAYVLSVNAPGMATFTSPQISLRGGEFHIMPTVFLSISAVATSVTVSGNQEQLSEQQVQIAEQQRVGGVIPNFYSSYDWNAPPMMAKQKFQLGVKSVLDPVSFLSVAGIAGAEQYRNIFPAYGSGLEGYGKRYGAALANHVSGTLLGRAVFPAIFHQDPRYFYKGKGSVGSRVGYAISAAVIARGDDGKWKPNYSRVLGNFSAGAISNLYYPASDRGGSLVLLNGLAATGGDAVANLIREFVLRRFTSHVPKDALGQP